MQPLFRELQEIVTQAVHAMEVAAKGRGLLLNYAQGKTEVMLHLVGRGSTAAKVALNDAHNVMEWNVEEHKYQVRVVHCYKHLGTWLQTRRKNPAKRSRPEVRQHDKAGELCIDPSMPKSMWRFRRR